MKKEEFYRKYANLQIDKRFIALDFIKYGMMSLNDVYTRISKADEQRRSLELEIESLLKVAENSKLLS